MIYKIEEKDEFLLVKVNATEVYYRLYLDIKKIQQIQLIAKKDFMKKWESFDYGYRTHPDKLHKTWSVKIDIEKLNFNQAIELCPEICNIEYSTKMLEDKAIRKKTEYELFYLQRKDNISR